MDERIGGAPLGVAHQLELAELAVVARLGPGVDLDAAGLATVGEKLRQLAAQATPVGQHVSDPDRLGAARPQLDAHPFGHPSGAGRDRLGVETQLQDVAGLGLVAGELGIDRFVGERAGLCPTTGVVDPAQEVGDAPDALVHERHLEHDVMTLGEDVTDPVDPLLERLAPRPVLLGHLEHRKPFGPVAVEHRPLVFEALVEQHLGHLPEWAPLDGARARLDLEDAALVLANPVPEADQLDPSLHDEVLTEALAAAEAGGVRGRDVTPFLLARFHDRTGGASLEVNVRLVVANARLAARVAAAAATG